MVFCNSDVVMIFAMSGERKDIFYIIEYIGSYINSEYVDSAISSFLESSACASSSSKARIVIQYSEMKTHTKILSFVEITATLFALLSPAAVHAAPGGVSGISASVVNGEVLVQWSAPISGDAVTGYRVYYSQESILENGGTYDDFEESAGTATQYSLKDLPAAPMIYVSVLAVNAAGQESNFFLEEAPVDLSSLNVPSEEPTVDPEPQQSSSIAPPPASSSIAPVASSSVAPVVQASSSAAPVQAPASAPSSQETPPLPLPTSEMFALVKAEAVSATGVLLTFSLPVILDSKQAAQAFAMKNSSGTQLSLRRLLIAGNRVEIHTEPQVRGAAYIVEVGSVVQGQSSDPAKGPVAMNAEQNKALFLGHASGIEAPNASSKLPVPLDVAGLRIASTPESNGRYTVTATWTSTNSPDLVSGYEIRQSQDNGRTFAAPQQAPADATTVRLQGVPSGEFGISVRVISPFNTVSNGVFTSVLLPGLTKPKTPLSNSGPGIVIAMMGAGGLMGWRRMRRKSGV